MTSLKKRSNEELETSRAGLQSQNEALNTINARLQEKVEELEAATNDVVNLLASTHIATVFLDKKLRIKRYTPASARLLSLVPTDVGRPVADILRRFRDEAFLDDTARVLADSTPMFKEVQADDGRTYVRRITPYRTQDDRIEGAVVTFVDVSDLKRAEEKTQSAALFPEENPFPILRAARDGTLLYANRAAGALLDQWQCRVGTPVPELVKGTLAAAVRSGTPRELEICCGDRELSFELVPIVERSYVNFYGRDITQRKQAEEALRDSQTALSKANEELEQKVRERTATLAQLVDSLQEEVEQRQRAEVELRKANEQLNARAAQLRALAGELTMAEQRERKRMAQILHDHLQQQLASAKLQVSCLDELDGESLVLAATQIEEILGESIRLSRSLTAELSPPVLHEAGLAAGLEWLGRWMAGKHGLGVELALEKDLPAVAEDVKILLFESTRELLFNAAKHARVAAARVVLRQIEGTELQVMVSDNGPGFDPAKMKAPGESGTGFGLLSIRERLGLIGGRLEIDSAPGNGSRFSLTVPLLQATAGVEEAAARQEAPPVCLPEPGARIRVLVADDHAVMRQSLALMLSQEPDIEVVGEAQDGAEAVTLAENLRPDVILMDISMPGMNGIEATRSISAVHSQICVIGLSMYEEGERSQAIRDAGATDYVTKSAPKAHLIAAIRGCMGGGSD